MYKHVNERGFYMLPSEDLNTYKLNCHQEVRTRYQYYIQKVGGRVRLATNYKLGFLLK